MRRKVLMSIVAAAIGCGTVHGAAAPFYITALDSAKSQLNRLTASLGTSYTKFPRTVTNGTRPRSPTATGQAGFSPAACGSCRRTRTTQRGKHGRGAGRIICRMLQR